MKKALLITATLLFTLIVVAVPALVGIRPFIGAKARPLTDRRFAPSAARLERGRYLVSSGEAPCAMCHSPIDVSSGGLKVKADAELTGRHWGVDGVPFLTALNLTPDAETGIADFTDDELARAIREGIGRDGRALFPIMPYQKFRGMADEDLASVIVYLRSLKSVRNPLPPSAVPFPLNRLINSAPEPIDAPVSADLSTPHKRGEYIVRMAACADCHTTRDERGGNPPGMEFAGGTAMPFEGRKTIYTANITPSANGIPYYTEDLFIEVMRTGALKGRVLDPMMPTSYFKNMTDQDLKDVFAYLQTLKPVDHFVDNSQAPTACARCGLEHGGGGRNKK